MALLIAIGFLAGVITAISPCVLPVLPILLAGGASGRRPLRVIAGLVTSFSVFTLFATWILGRLVTAGWDGVFLVFPYIAISLVVIVLHRRLLDVLSVGDDEATSLGISARRIRLVVVIAATLGTAAAVAIAGTIAFVGIIVPHTVRLLTGRSYRVVIPLSVFFGGAFLVLADTAARTVVAPAELSIGVLTAFIGAPFFIAVMRSTRAAEL